MMGRKARCCTPVSAVSLDELVPADHFYRHVERVLDLSFVRDLVQDCFAAGGRPSVDPIVFFRAICEKQRQAWVMQRPRVCVLIRPTSKNVWCERWLTVSPCEKPLAALV
jgi:hypothetical protein